MIFGEKLKIFLVFLMDWTMVEFAIGFTEVLWEIVFRKYSSNNVR